jgi:hypothetical protein
MPQTLLTEREYWSEVQLLSNEIEQARIIYHTYEEINRLAIHDEVIAKSLNRDAQFWQTQMHCLQTTMFMTLSRIFDNHPNARTIHTVVSATMGNIHLFSAPALEARKAVGDSRPWWLDDYMKTVWSPREPADLKHLKKALTPVTKRFEEIYRPIRHAIFAHRIMTDDESAVQLFGGTNRTEVGQIINVLHELIEVIKSLYENGMEPVLTTPDLTSYNQRVRDGVQAVLKRLD